MNLFIKYFVILLLFCPSIISAASRKLVINPVVGQLDVINGYTPYISQFTLPGYEFNQIGWTTGNYDVDSTGSTFGSNILYTNTDGTHLSVAGQTNAANRRASIMKKILSGF